MTIYTLSEAKEIVMSDIQLEYRIKYFSSDWTLIVTKDLSVLDKFGDDVEFREVLKLSIESKELLSNIYNQIEAIQTLVENQSANFRQNSNDPSDTKQREADLMLKTLLQVRESLEAGRASIANVASESI